MYKSRHRHRSCEYNQRKPSLWKVFVLRFWFSRTECGSVLVGVLVTLVNMRFWRTKKRILLKIKKKNPKNNKAVLMQGQVKKTKT